METLLGKNVLITGAARRIGRALALSVAKAGGTVLIHYSHSKEEAIQTQTEIQELGQTAYILQGDFTIPDEVINLFLEAEKYGKIFALVNNASIFEPLSWDNTNLDAWNLHLKVNLTAPFLLSQSFARSVIPGENGRIVNILDWRALRPGYSHLPYIISKSALAALTQSLAIALAPNINVNGLALGAILPPINGSDVSNIAKMIPAGRWGDVVEVGEALIYLLTGPSYITGEIIHVDGGRHLV